MMYTTCNARRLTDSCLRVCLAGGLSVMLYASTAVAQTPPPPYGPYNSQVGNQAGNQARNQATPPRYRDPGHNWAPRPRQSSSNQPSAPRYYDPSRASMPSSPPQAYGSAPYQQSNPYGAPTSGYRSSPYGYNRGSSPYYNQGYNRYYQQGPRNYRPYPRKKRNKRQFWGDTTPADIMRPSKDNWEQAWDDMMLSPSRAGEMPGGWYAPEVYLPNPVDMGDQFQENIQDLPEQIKDMDVGNTVEDDN